MIDIDIRGVKEIQSFLKEFGEKGRQIIDDELRIIAINLRTDMIKSMRESPAGKSFVHGRIYRSSVSRAKHIASMPGYPPRIDSGNLINRLFVDSGDGFSRLYTENVEYVKYLEEGTSKMKPRPFIAPAIERSNWQQHIVNRIIAERFAGRRLEA